MILVKKNNYAVNVNNLSRIVIKNGVNLEIEYFDEFESKYKVAGFIYDTKEQAKIAFDYLTSYFEDESKDDYITIYISDEVMEKFNMIKEDLTEMRDDLKSALKNAFSGVKSDKCPIHGDNCPTRNKWASRRN